MNANRPRIQPSKSAIFAIVWRLRAPSCVRFTGCSCCISICLGGVSFSGWQVISSKVRWFWDDKASRSNSRGVVSILALRSASCMTNCSIPLGVRSDSKVRESFYKIIEVKSYTWIEGLDVTNRLPFLHKPHLLHQCWLEVEETKILHALEERTIRGGNVFLWDRHLLKECFFTSCPFRFRTIVVRLEIFQQLDLCGPAPLKTWTRHDVRRPGRGPWPILDIGEHLATLYVMIREVCEVDIRQSLIEEVDELSTRKRGRASGLY